MVTVLAVCVNSRCAFEIALTHPFTNGDITKVQRTARRHARNTGHSVEIVSARSGCLYTYIPPAPAGA